MCLVDDDREAALFVFRADVVENEREFLNRRDDDLLAVGHEAAEIAASLPLSKLMVANVSFNPLPTPWLT
jgi:hypothetical protein